MNLIKGSPSFVWILNDLRKEIKIIAAEEQWREKYPNWWKNHKEPWERSLLCDRKNGVQFRFENLRCGIMDIEHVVAVFKIKYPLYITTIHGFDLHVCLADSIKVNLPAKLIDVCSE